jgi:hypothetical protein
MRGGDCGDEVCLSLQRGAVERRENQCDGDCNTGYETGEGHFGGAFLFRAVDRLDGDVRNTWIDEDRDLVLPGATGTV